jgi:hypothetical protein
MTSDHKITSNRSNGSRGRGPRTPTGKASSSRNALRHGLTVSVLNDPAMCAEVEKLARALAGEQCDDFQLSQARIIAEAQIDLARIQDVKIGLLNSQLEMVPNIKTLKQVDRLERYVVAAISRRRLAMRAFLTHR